MAKKTPPPTVDLDIKKLQEEIVILDTNWKRALADYQNLVKRADVDKKEFVKYATANLISKFIPSLDILELAANHSQDAGVKLAVKQLQETLLAEGLEPISPSVSTAFDHRLHECIETLSGQPEDTIAELVSKGYKIGDFVIRPAKVKVYKSQ
jgi:molecular chaperone GrpE